MNNILTFNELKEIAKKIAMDDDRVEKLYIEQLETQSMSSDVNFFNVLYLVKDLSFDDTSFEFIEHFGDILTMYENTEKGHIKGSMAYSTKVGEYKIGFDGAWIK